MAALVRSVLAGSDPGGNMTQLNLSGKQSTNTQQNQNAESEGGSIKNQTVGALGALAMFAAVMLPTNSYPGTDFKSGFVNLSVNPGMTSEACTQFAFPESKAGTEQSSKDTTGTDTTKKVKIGDVEFSQVQNSTAGAMKQTD